MKKAIKRKLGIKSFAYITGVVDRWICMAVQRTCARADEQRGGGGEREERGHARGRRRRHSALHWRTARLRTATTQAHAYHAIILRIPRGVTSREE